MEEVYFYHAMDWSVFSLDLKYGVHKIYGYRVKTFHLLVTERTPITQQTQRNLFQAKEEEMVKRWDRGNGKQAFPWAREEMTDKTTLWNYHTGALLCSS